MNIAFSSPQVLHLSVTPGIKSWSVFVGIIAVGVGASYYSPDDHILHKTAYLVGCLILGLTFLDDWEDCVFDKGQGQVTVTRRCWWEWLISRCATHNTLVLDTGTVMAVRVSQAHGRLSEGYQVVLVLRAGGTVPVCETTFGCKSEQEEIASKVRTFLCLDRVETLSTGATWREWTDTDEDEDYLFFDHPSIEVESLEGSGNLNFDEVKIENENNVVVNEENDSDTSSEDEPFDNVFAE